MAKRLPQFLARIFAAHTVEEAVRLVADGYATVEDVEIGLRDGVALHWSFMGPFETIDLNAPGGVRDFVARCKEHWQMSTLKGNTKVWIYHLLKSK